MQPVEQGRRQPPPAFDLVGGGCDGSADGSGAGDHAGIAR